MATAPDRYAPANSITLRAMSEADLSAVMGIERGSYAFPWTEGLFRDCLRVGYLCCVAEMGGAAVVGYAVMSYGAGEAHILNLCVREASRCAGVGRQIIRHLLDRARGAGMDDAFLEVRPSNAIAARLYDSLGFEQIGIRRGYYQAVGGREDAIVLRLRLRG
jgi:ribosomal-protein-alanine N-acetyltransferase